MKEVLNKTLEGERALFASDGVKVVDCTFDNGESPFKESRNVEVVNSEFRWKYPLWYCQNVKVDSTTWFEMGRAGVWYTNDILVANSVVHAPKNFRRCKNLTLENVSFTNAAETVWQCENVNLKDVKVENGDYFAMNCSDMKVEKLDIVGNYTFDGAKNVEIRDSRLICKDAFWNSENITVYNSYIEGEYLGWNSKNLTLIDCTISSLQGLCYIENLTLKNCKLDDTTLAFEYSEVNGDFTKVASILNPGKAEIKADYIGELIIEKDIADEGKLHIECGEIKLKSDLPEWKR